MDRLTKTREKGVAIGVLSFAVAVVIEVPPTLEPGGYRLRWTL